MADELQRREIAEAIAAGEQALRSLRAAQDKLDSASNWGIFDMLGGGLISSMVKHSRMEEANQYLTAAKETIAVFERELEDVSGMGQLEVDVGGFLSFADLFLDNIFVDYMVQNKISEAKEQVQEAIRQVETVLRRLRGI